MKQKRRDIKISGAVRDLHHLRLMALLLELVRLRGIGGTARVLEIDPRTVTSSVQSEQLTRRVRDSLQRALQHGIGSAADRQRERSDKLETRLDKMEGQLKELREQLPSALKRLRMSLDGVRKYYGVQRRLIDQRLLVTVTRPGHPQVMRVEIPDGEALRPRAVRPGIRDDPPLTSSCMWALLCCLQFAQSRALG